MAQTLAGMLSIAAIQTVNTLKKEKKYIERVVSYGIAANSSNQAIVLQMIINFNLGSIDIHWSNEINVPSAFNYALSHVTMPKPV